jgi:AraC-like DNA-binding protein
MKRGSRELVIWQYTSGGMGELTFNGSRCELHSGEAMLLIVPEQHCYSLPAISAYWDISFVSLNGGEVVRMARECRRWNNGPVFHHQQDSKVLQTAQKICHECRKMDVFRASALAYQFMTELLSETVSAHRENATATRIVQDVRQYCMNHLTETLDVETLAEITGYSRWHFTRIFEEAAGMTPGKFVTDLRMRAAQRMLQSTHWRIKEIAAACGYNDPSYFCKIFKSTLGKSPGDFRKQ